LSNKTHREKIIRLPIEIIFSKETNERLNVFDRKLYCYLIYIIQKKYWSTLSLNKFSVTIEDLLHVFDTTKEKEILRSLENLSSIEYYDYNSTQKLIGYLSNLVIDENMGNINFSLNTPILDSFLNMKSFALLSFDKLYLFETYAGIRLFEIMSIYVKRQHPTWNVSLSNLKNYLKINDKNERFNNFKARVLEKALKEVEDYADFFITIQYIKEGKGGKVVSLKITANSTSWYGLMKLEERILKNKSNR
jgi:plasmid replication initiation protein